MRILFLANLDMGLYKFRKELLKELVRENEVFFCVPYGEYIERLQAIGCQFMPCAVLDSRGTNPIKDLKLLKFYCRIIKEVNPDVVLTYTIKPNVYGGLACQITSTPYIANITGIGTSIENGGLLSTIAVTLYKLGLRKARCVFFQNAQNQNFFIRKKIICGNSRLLPGSGVNLDFHKLAPYPSEADGIRFLFVGRLMKNKGIEEFLLVMKILHEENNAIAADIVGWFEEDYTDNLRQAQENGEIVFHDKQDDVRPFYRCSHCVVLPSYHEGKSNVMLEASAAGRPVITTRVPGCIETFEEGITGLGCEARSAESLLEVMRRFLLLSREARVNMGLNARKKMEREYDRGIVIKAYLDEIAKVVKYQ